MSDLGDVPEVDFPALLARISQPLSDPPMLKSPDILLPQHHVESIRHTWFSSVHHWQRSPMHTHHLHSRAPAPMQICTNMQGLMLMLDCRMQEVCLTARLPMRFLGFGRRIEPSVNRLTLLDDPGTWCREPWPKSKYWRSTLGGRQSLPVLFKPFLRLRYPVLSYGLERATLRGCERCASVPACHAWRGYLRYLVAGDRRARWHRDNVWV